MTGSATERAARQYMQRRRRQLRAIGQWQDPQVDAQPVREHVLALREAGMSEPALTRRLNLPQSALKNMMRGANGRPPGKTVARETAEAVLGYWPELADFSDTASIDPTGTLRRVHALETLGFSKRWMAAELDLLQQNFKTSLRGKTLSARLARGVAALYDRLWMDTAEDHGVAPYVAARVRRYAAERGYFAPLAWDDDTIDDPKAVPMTDAVEPVVSEGDNLAARWLLGESVILGLADRKEVLAHLFEWTNHTTEEIAARLDMSPDAAEQQWNRIKRKARAEGRRVWRRVYVPRINQDDMEEVA